jgi:hypothetical protein
LSQYVKDITSGLGELDSGSGPSDPRSDDWLTVTGPAPLYLQTLIAVKMADEQWKHGEGSAVPTVVIAAEP